MMLSMKPLSFALMMSSLFFINGALGYQELFVDVVCHPENPTVCVGEREIYGPVIAALPDGCYSDPIPVGLDCTPTYQGGYDWIYRFVTGLAEGSETYDLSPEERAEYFTGFEIKVRMEDNYTCSVTVGDEMCKSCSGCDIDEGIKEYIGNDAYSFSADCSNVKKGAKVECAPLDPIFYPLKLKGKGKGDKGKSKDD